MYKQIKGFKMSISNKLKNKILNNKDKSDNLGQELEDLKNEFEKYKNYNDKIITSNNLLFNKIFLDFEIKPKGVLKLTQELCTKLLDFYVNVCKKYDLEYWIDYGNLLGAVRHEGFVPWDDDVDVGMMRADSLKFKEIIEEEVKLHNLDDLIRLRFVRRIRETRSPSFTEISVYDGAIYAGIDVFPYDYVANPPKNLKKEFKIAKKEYTKNVYNGMDKKEVIDNYYNSLNCSYEKQKYFLSSIEAPPIGRNGYKVSLFETDKVFPLGEIEFEGKTYACPRDPHYYIPKVYGDDYMKIPKVIRYHKRMDGLKRQENIEEKFKNFSERLDKANSEF